MSSRVLKKLQGDKELKIPDDGDQNKDQILSDEDDDDHGKVQHLNPFDLLNQQSFSESEVKEDDNETATSAATPATAGSTSKKKKKKRKKKTKSTGNHISSEDNELTDKYMSDMDSFIGKVPEENGQNSKLTTTPRIQLDKSLLAVELKNLNPQNELRRTFGKRVVKVENKRGRQKLTLKSTYMVTAKDMWPPLLKNIITMKPISPPDNPVTTSGTSIIDKTEDKTQWFTFEHSSYYQNVQNQFLSAVERTDSDFLINLIRRCPYHVDALIQLSELCKMTEDYSLAGELIERALLVLESSLHPSFSLISGNCRLDYRRQENRSFFIVLFKQAQYLEARACCRTAFELAKLILTFNPGTDPLAMVLILDYYALRSKQYSWLVKFYEEYDAVRNLSQLPNMAYSYALALFCLHGECEKADKAVQYALLMFPGVLRPLLDELSVQTDKRVLAAPYFNAEISGSQSPALHQLVCLYICRAKVVWRQNNILPWLERNVNLVLDRIERQDAIIVDYNQRRAARYIAPPRPILRHTILSDYKEKVPLAAFVAKEKEPILMHDPLPPLDSINCYERKSSSSSPTTATQHSVSMFFQSLLPSFNLNNTTGGDQQQQQQQPQQQQQQQQQQRHQQNADANANANAVAARAPVPPIDDDEVAQVNLHLQALNMNLETAAVEGGAVGGAETVSTPYRELTQSFTNIVDAMREFLNLRMGEQSQNADGEANGSSEEDSSDYFD